MPTPTAQWDFTSASCPRCGATGLTRLDDKRLRCRGCNTEYAISESVCPECMGVNPPGTAFCMRCGAALQRACPACHTKNWAGASNCSACGEALDVLEGLSTRRQQTTQKRLHQQMEDSRAIKAHEASSADERSRMMWEAEERRQAQLKEDAKRQAANEQRMITIAISGVSALIILVLLVVVVQMIVAK